MHMGALDFLLVMHWHVTITYVTYKGSKRFTKLSRDCRDFDPRF